MYILINRKKNEMFVNGKKAKRVYVGVNGKAVKTTPNEAFKVVSKHVLGA